MAKAAVPTRLQRKHLTQEEKRSREELEQSMKGKSDEIKPPEYLSKPQKKIFRNIVKQLQESGILSNLDIYILSTCAIDIDRIQEMELKINEDKMLLSNKDFMNSKDKYTKDFFRCCSELSLSPQARAKICTLKLNTNKMKNDPVLKALSGDGDE